MFAENQKRQNFSDVLESDSQDKTHIEEQDSEVNFIMDQQAPIRTNNISGLGT